MVVRLGREGGTLLLRLKKNYITRRRVVVSKSEVGAVLRVSEESFMFMGLNVSFVTEQCTLSLVISFFLIKPD